VVAPDGESLNFVFDIIFRGEKKYGCGVSRSAKPLRHTKPVHVGQHDIEDDEVWFLFKDGGDRSGAIRDGADAESGKTKAGAQQLANARFVVDNENAWSFVHARQYLTVCYESPEDCCVSE